MWRAVPMMLAESCDGLRGRAGLCCLAIAVRAPPRGSNCRWVSSRCRRVADERRAERLMKPPNFANVERTDFSASGIFPAPLTHQPDGHTHAHAPATLSYLRLQWQPRQPRAPLRAAIGRGCSITRLRTALHAPQLIRQPHCRPRPSAASPALPRAAVCTLRSAAKNKISRQNPPQCPPPPRRPRGPPPAARAPGHAAQGRPSRRR